MTLSKKPAPIEAAQRVGRIGRRAPRFVIVTGLSGSGKSQAIRALEDLGYFCVDNLPTTLIPTMAEMARRQGLTRVAIVVDVRERDFLSEFPKVYAKLRKARGIDPALIFLEASEAALVRRFSETRRPHPLAPDRPVTEGLQEERTRMDPIRRMADAIIDTSSLTVHELRQAFLNFSRGATGRSPLVITISSFGYKHGIPMDADLVFDVRFLPNPHFVARLRKLTGRDPRVVRFIDKHAASRDFQDRIVDLLKFLVPMYIQEGKSYLTIGIGCTGGKHRSVMIAEALKRRLRSIADGVSVRVKHRDIQNE